MAIKCIALDLDRTTLNVQGKLSKGNREALEYVIKKGIYVVVANFGNEDAKIRISGGNFVSVTDNNSCPEVLGAEQVLVLKEAE